MLCLNDKRTTGRELPEIGTTAMAHLCNNVHAPFERLSLMSVINLAYGQTSSSPSPKAVSGASEPAAQCSISSASVPERAPSHSGANSEKTTPIMDPIASSRRGADVPHLSLAAMRETQEYLEVRAITIPDRKKGHSADVSHGSRYPVADSTSSLDGIAETTVPHVDETMGSIRVSFIARPGAGNVSAAPSHLLTTALLAEDDIVTTEERPAEPVEKCTAESQTEFAVLHEDEFPQISPISAAMGSNPTTPGTASQSTPTRQPTPQYGARATSTEAKEDEVVERRGRIFTAAADPVPAYAEQLTQVGELIKRELSRAIDTWHAGRHLPPTGTSQTALGVSGDGSVNDVRDAMARDLYALKHQLEFLRTLPQLPVAAANAPPPLAPLLYQDRPPEPSASRRQVHYTSMEGSSKEPLVDVRMPRRRISSINQENKDRHKYNTPQSRRSSLALSPSALDSFNSMNESHHGSRPLVRVCVVRDYDATPIPYKKPPRSKKDPPKKPSGDSTIHDYHGRRHKSSANSYNSFASSYQSSFTTRHSFDTSARGPMRPSSSLSRRSSFMEESIYTESD